MIGGFGSIASVDQSIVNVDRAQVSLDWAELGQPKPDMCRSQGYPRGTAGLNMGYGLRIWSTTDWIAEVHGLLSGSLEDRVHPSFLLLGSRCTWCTEHHAPGFQGSLLHCCGMAQHGEAQWGYLGSLRFSRDPTDIAKCKDQALPFPRSTMMAGGHDGSGVNLTLEQRRVKGAPFSMLVRSRCAPKGDADDQTLR